MDSMEASLVALQGRVNSLSEPGSAPASSAADTRASSARTGPFGSNPYTDPDSPWSIPIGKRTTIVVGGYPFDTDRDVIEASLRDITGSLLGVRDFHASGKFASTGKIIFDKNKFLWDFLKGSSLQTVH